jgi:hypothetical protein
MKFGEEVRKGLIDENKKNFREKDKGRVMYVKDEVDEGIIGLKYNDGRKNN